nr:hypothetical protein B0A51_07866 [Rachicladosporium sp. CCFEE 5018]
MSQDSTSNVQSSSSDAGEEVLTTNVEMEDAGDDSKSSGDHDMQDRDSPEMDSQDDGLRDPSAHGDGTMRVEQPGSDAVDTEAGDVMRHGTQHQPGVSSDAPDIPGPPTSPRSEADPTREYFFSQAHNDKLRNIKAARRQIKEDLEKTAPLAAKIEEEKARLAAEASKTQPGGVEPPQGWQRPLHHPHSHPRPYDPHYDPESAMGPSDPKRTRTVTGDDEADTPAADTDQPVIPMEDDHEPQPRPGVNEQTQPPGGDDDISEMPAPKPATKQAKATYKDVPYIPIVDSFEILQPGEIETVGWDRAPSSEVQDAVKKYWDEKVESSDKERHPLKVWLAQDNWAVGTCLRASAGGGTSTRTGGKTRDDACDTCINKHIPCLVTGAGFTQVVLLPEKDKVFGEAFDYILGGAEDVPTTSRGGRPPRRRRTGSSKA